MTLEQFLYDHIGRKREFDGAYPNQCVDLVQFYNRDVVKAPRFNGNAKDYWNNYPKDFYYQIGNQPDNYPIPGDIAVWDAGVGRGNGHVAIVIEADVMRLASLGQNWPENSAVSYVIHNYRNVIGWLRPRNPIKIRVSEISSEEVHTYKEKVKAAVIDVINRVKTII